MNLEDLYKLAGVVKSAEPTEVQADTPVQEQPINPRDDMKAFIALVTPEQLNKLTGEAPVEEEGFANSGDEYAGEPEEYKGPLGSPADLSLRRYLDANGQPVHVEENVYPDHKVEDITEAWNEYKIDEKKAKPDFADIDGDGDKKESMKKAAKDKEEKEKADESVEENQDITDLKRLSGIAEAPFPGEYDYTDPKYMHADGTPKSDHSEFPKVYNDEGVMVADDPETALELIADEISEQDHKAYMDAASEGDYEALLDALDGFGYNMGTGESAEINDLKKLSGIAEAPGEYDYSDDKYDADGAVTGVGKQGYDMRFAKWSEDTPSEVMMVIKKYDLGPDDAYQMATADVNADIDAIADLHDEFVDRTGSDSDIDSGDEWLASPEYDKVMTMVGDLCSAMGMEGAGREECGQALMKHVDENAPKESAEINDLRKLAGV